MPHNGSMADPNVRPTEADELARRAVEAERVTEEVSAAAILPCRPRELAAAIPACR